MKEEIKYIERTTEQRCIEQVYGGSIVNFMYGGSFIGKLLQLATARLPAFSWLYGMMMKTPWTTNMIAPFIKKYGIDASEFEKPIGEFSSFNDFFIRRLKPEARPIAPGSDKAVIPADGRYFFYPDISLTDGFAVKGKKFSLEALLQDRKLAEKYEHGAMVMARLCPTDYHRFHFPIDCIPEKTRLINGYLYSVNPTAIRQNIDIFTENKRTFTPLKTTNFGTVLFMEIGATSVGSIIQTAAPGINYKKGAEKGYFSFGASSLILLFEPGTLTFDKDLLDLTKKGLEIRCLMGQPMGTSIS